MRVKLAFLAPDERATRAEGFRSAERALPGSTTGHGFFDVFWFAKNWSSFFLEPTNWKIFNKKPRLANLDWKMFRSQVFTCVSWATRVPARRWWRVWWANSCWPWGPSRRPRALKTTGPSFSSSLGGSCCRKKTPEKNGPPSFFRHLSREKTGHSDFLVQGSLSRGLGGWTHWCHCYEGADNFPQFFWSPDLGLGTLKKKVRKSVEFAITKCFPQVCFGHRQCMSNLVELNNCCVVASCTLRRRQSILHHFHGAKVDFKGLTKSTRSDLQMIGFAMLGWLLTVSFQKTTSWK